VLAIAASIGRLIATAGGIGISYLYHRRRSTRRFSRALRSMGISIDEVDILTRGYRDMVSLPRLRQFTHHRKG